MCSISLHPYSSWINSQKKEKEKGTLRSAATSYEKHWAGGKSGVNNMRVTSRHVSGDEMSDLFRKVMVLSWWRMKVEDKPVVERKHLPFNMLILWSASCQLNPWSFLWCINGNTEWMQTNSTSKYGFCWSLKVMWLWKHSYVVSTLLGNQLILMPFLFLGCQMLSFCLILWHCIDMQSKGVYFNPNHNLFCWLLSTLEIMSPPLLYQPPFEAFIHLQMGLLHVKGQCNCSQSIWALTLKDTLWVMGRRRRHLKKLHYTARRDENVLASLHH